VRLTERYTDPTVQGAGNLDSGSDAGWLDEVVRRFGDRLVRFAWTYTQDREAAQDVAQDTFVRLHQHHQKHPHEPVTEAWLFTVARRILIDRHRQSLRAPPTVNLDDARPVAAQVTDPERRVVLWDEVAKLPEHERIAVVLFYYQDWSIRDVAHQLAVSENAVRLRLMRARERLMRNLGEEFAHG
jgi:RNA polymerase sigma-70 factor (ECF subfamily)